MIYFCADDYGIASAANRRIEDCLKNGVLNKVSVLPNGEITDFKKRLTDRGAVLSLHINLVEGKALSRPEDIPLLVSETGKFQHSFVGLFFLSFSPKRKELKKQIFQELKAQIDFWRNAVGEEEALSVDSHQHTHMIPLIFKTLMRVIREEELNIREIRFPAEPIVPFLLTPSLYTQYHLVGFIKQWLLKALGFVNRKELKKSKIRSTYFMGIMFSGKLNGEKIRKLLLHYLKLAEKHHKNIEIGFHPGYIDGEEDLIDGSRTDFGKFYFSPWRKTEYDTLLNFKF